MRSARNARSPAAAMAFPRARATCWCQSRCSPFCAREQSQAEDLPMTPERTPTARLRHRARRDRCSPEIRQGLRYRCSCMSCAPCRLSLQMLAIRYVSLYEPAPIIAAAHGAQVAEDSLADAAAPTLGSPWVTMRAARSCLLLALLAPALSKKGAAPKTPKAPKAPAPSSRRRVAKRSPWCRRSASDTNGADVSRPAGRRARRLPSDAASDAARREGRGSARR